MAVNSGASVELPRWKCHKEVHAAKIGSVQIDESDANIIRLSLLDGDRAFATADVSYQWVLKHCNERGPYIKVEQPGYEGDLGYFVRYRDGYTSWSPSSEFEDGYTRIEGRS